MYNIISNGITNYYKMIECDKASGRIKIVMPTSQALPDVLSLALILKSRLKREPQKL